MICMAQTLFILGLLVVFLFFTSFPQDFYKVSAITSIVEIT